MMCDTYVIFPADTEDGSFYFGKNSDREPDEAQVVEIHPLQDHPDGAGLRATYIEIPQVRHTYGIIISRPYWIWGAEMGVNEFGLAIGNEAIFTKVKREDSYGLIGMDLLRLALERAKNREEAVEVITSLLAEYGQEGPCGHRNKKLRYDNSFLIVDGKGAIVLETYGREWAFREVDGSTSISNIISLSTDYDEVSEGIGKNVRKVVSYRGKIDLFKTYSDWLYTTFAGGKERKKLFGRKLKEMGKVDLWKIFDLHRAHSSEDFHPAKGGNSDLCMHAVDPLVRISQTANSMVVRYRGKGEFDIFFTGTSLPCTSFFIPVKFSSDEFIPEDSPPHGVFTQGSWWWEHEVLVRMLINRWYLFNEYRAERDRIEKEFVGELLKNYTETLREDYIERIRDFRKRWIERLKEEKIERGHILFKFFRGRLNKRNELPFIF